MAPGLGGSGSFRPRRLDTPRPLRKPLEKEESSLMETLRKQTPEKGGKLDRSGFKAVPKPPELPAGWTYARGCRRR